MKRFNMTGTPAKLGVLAATVGLLFAGGTAAYAEDGAELTSTVTLYPMDCYTEGDLPVLIGATYNLADNEGIDTILVDGQALPGDAEFRAGPGEHGYTYHVFNNDGAETTRSSSFTVETCKVTPKPITAPAPTQAGQNVTIPSAEGVEYFDTSSGETLTGTVQVPDGGSLVVGARPSGDAPVNGGPWTFTWEAPVDPEPVAPVVGADLHGLLTEDNTSAVYAVVTVQHNDAEGPLTVIVSHEGAVKPDATLEFLGDGEETLRLTIPMDKCGDVDFDVRFAGSEAGQTYTVDVPCPATTGNGDDDGDDDGNNNGNTGGTDDGNTDGSNTGNTDGSSNNNGTSNGNTNGSTDNGSKDTGKVAPPAAHTGDTVVSTSSPFGYTLMGGGALLLMLLAAMRVVGLRKSATASNR